VIKPFYRYWLGGFVAVVGAMSAIIALTPVKMTPALSVGTLTVAVFASGLWASYVTKPRHLPSPDELPFKAGTRLQWPCDTTFARQASAMAKRFYGQEAIRFERYELWRIANPDILVCLIDASHEVVGYFDVLPLKHEAMEMFIQGSLVESKFSHEDICPPAVARTCERLYLAGIAVTDPARHADRRNAAILVWAFIKYLEHFYAQDDKERELFALASTTDGEALIRGFEFRVARPAAAREDQHNLYKCRVSSSSLKQVLGTMADWGKVVPLPWESQHLPAVSATGTGKPKRPSQQRRRMAPPRSI
jgi:hypothetical protein